MKVVYNCDYGGFILSDEAVELLNQKRTNAGLSPYENIMIKYGDRPALGEMILFL